MTTSQKIHVALNTNKFDESIAFAASSEKSP